MSALATRLLLLGVVALCSPAPLHAQDDSEALVGSGRIAAGVGLGMRTLGWPVDRSEASVDLGVFPALDLGAAFSLRLTRGFSLGTSCVYQSSIAHEINEPRVGNSAETQSVRSHRFEAALVPELRFDEAIRLQVFAGYAVRNLHPEVHHLQTPRATLSGPFLRPMLRLPIGTGSLALRFGPELQWIAAVSSELSERGVNAGGIAVGGELVFEVKLSAMFALELAYRESHALLHAKLGDASDGERFVTARLAGEL